VFWFPRCNHHPMLHQFHRDEWFRWVPSGFFIQAHHGNASSSRITGTCVRLLSGKAEWGIILLPSCCRILFFVALCFALFFPSSSRFCGCSWSALAQLSDSALSPPCSCFARRSFSASFALAFWLWFFFLVHGHIRFAVPFVHGLR